MDLGVAFFVDEGGTLHCVTVDSHVNTTLGFKYDAGKIDKQNFMQQSHKDQTKYVSVEEKRWRYATATFLWQKRKLILPIPRNIEDERTPPNIFERGQHRDNDDR